MTLKRIIGVPRRLARSDIWPYWEVLVGFSLLVACGLFFRATLNGQSEMIELNTRLLNGTEKPSTSLPKARAVSSSEWNTAQMKLKEYIDESKGAVNGNE